MDVIVWPSKNTSVSQVSHILNENPSTGYLNEFNTEVRGIEISDPDFLVEFQWSILEAKMRPQFHVVILDNNLVTRKNLQKQFQICACAIDFVSTHPMKYVIFYDLVNFKNVKAMDSSMTLSCKIRRQTENLSSFARLHTHLGPSFQSHFSTANDILDQSGLKILAKSIIHLVNQILSKLND
jgi:hypothetical protein